MRVLIDCKDNKELQIIADDLQRAGLPDQIDAAIRTGSKRSFDDLKLPSGNWDVSFSAAEDILAAAAEHKPHIIAVADQWFGRQADPILFRQHLSDQLHRTGASFRVCRPRVHPASETARLLLGFDGSNSSLRALRLLTDRHFEIGSLVRIIAAADSALLSSIGRFLPQMSDSKVRQRFVSQWLNTMSTNAVGRLSNAGFDVSVESRMGEPVAVVLDEANRFDADMIIIGHHDHGVSEGATQSPDIAAEIARASDRSVEIVF